MADRHLTQLGVAVILAVITLLIPAHVAAQTGSGSRDDRTTPRTPWGDPDLQGVWTTDWERSVPFERPTEFGERAELTPEEIAIRAEREEIRLADEKDTRRSRPGRPGGWTRALVRIREGDLPAHIARRGPARRPTPAAHARRAEPSDRRQHPCSVHGRQPEWRSLQRSRRSAPGGPVYHTGSPPHLAAQRLQ